MINVTKQGYVPNSRSFFFSRTGTDREGILEHLATFCVRQSVTLFESDAPSI